jgi:hypothetical protein
MDSVPAGRMLNVGSDLEDYPFSFLCWQSAENSQVLDSKENIPASCILLLPAGGSLHSMLLGIIWEDTFKINEVTEGQKGKERYFGKSLALLLNDIYFDTVG